MTFDLSQTYNPSSICGRGIDNHIFDPISSVVDIVLDYGGWVRRSALGLDCGCWFCESQKLCLHDEGEDFETLTRVRCCLEHFHLANEIGSIITSVSRGRGVTIVIALAHRTCAHRLRRSVLRISDLIHP